MATKQLEQTNRTIMFSKINSKKPSLTKILSKTDEGKITISGEILKEIEDNLVVSSFDEFLKKFSPTIYSKSVNGEIQYSLRENGAGNWSETPINMSNDFLNLMVNIIDGKTGTTNIEFEYQEEFKRLLGVDATTKKIERAMDEIKYLSDCFKKAEPDSPEQKDLMKKGQKAYQRIVTDFNNPITLLPWYQGKVKAALIDKGAEPTFASDVEAKTKNLIGDRVVVDDNGIPMLEEIDDSDVVDTENANSNDSDKSSDAASDENVLGATLNRVYDAGVERGIVVADTAGKQMLTDLFGEANGAKKIEEKLALMEVPELTDRYNQFSKQIDSQYENFAKVAKQLIEEIVGIRMFFEQSKIARNKMPVKLVVTNDDLEDFTGKEDVLEQFLTRVNTTDSDYSKTIWYAVISNMSMDIEDEDPDWFDEPESKGDSSNNSVTSVTKMVRTLGKYGIQTFVGFENNKNNTFSDVQQSGITKYKETTKKFVDDEEVNKYFIPCLPNFTVVPEKNSRLRSQGKYEYREAEAINDEDGVEFIDNGHINLGGFYVNAAYIAAGIVTACQSPDYLEKKGIKTVKDVYIPGVRFDLERHFDKIDVKMGIEVGGYTEKVKDQINDEQYGFVFASEGGARTHIIKARNLKKAENGDFEPMFVTSTYTYIERLYKYNYTNNRTKDTMDAFFGPDNRSVFWNKYPDYDNALLQNNDVLEYNIEGNTANLELKLSGVEKQLNFIINH